MKHAALLTLLSFALCSPVMAKPHPLHHHQFRHHHHSAARTSHHADRHARTSHDADRHNRAVHSDTAHASHSGITCEMVRAYVAKVGMDQAIAMAKSAGITASEEERARQCLAKKI